jgi:hypothetical protein
MASASIVAKRPREIYLQYSSNGTVTATPEAQFRKGEFVVFVSDPGDEVYVKLNPHSYKPSVFTPTSGAVEVIAEPAETTSPALCGFVKTIGGQKVAYGWLPRHVHALRPNIAIPQIQGIETEP